MRTASDQSIEVVLRVVRSKFITLDRRASRSRHSLFLLVSFRGGFIGKVVPVSTRYSKATRVGMITRIRETQRFIREVIPTKT